MSEDEPLAVGIVDGRLVISIGINTLAFAVNNDMQRDDVIRVNDPALAAEEIARELRREDEEGTTAVHRLLDKAAFDAWENGGEGFEG